MTFQNVSKGGILIRLDWGQLVTLVEVEDDVLDVGLPHRLSGEHSFNDEEPQSYFWSMKSFC